MMVNERESRHFVWQINEDNVDLCCVTWIV